MKKKEVRPFRNLVEFSSSGESLILLKVASCVRDFDCWTPCRGGRLIAGRLIGVRLC